MIDNFEQIKSLLEFPNDDIYYHLQIIRRGKDHPNLSSANRCIKSYFICKLESIDILEEEIKNLCKFFGARAYINLAPKSIRKTTMLQLKYLAERAYIGDYKKIWKSWNTCAGEIKGEEPRWIVDLDDVTDLTTINLLKYFLTTLEPVGEKVKAVIQTKSGYHLITTSFNIKQFKSTPLGENIDVHKNNPTILYIP